MAVLRPINVEPIEGMGQLDGAVRKEGPVSSRTDLEVEKGGGDGYGRRPGTAGSLDERGGPAADDSGADFDASSEIGEIDRRLNALQNFLKQAKNGERADLPLACLSLGPALILVARACVSVFTSHGRDHHPHPDDAPRLRRSCASIGLTPRLNSRRRTVSLC